MLGGSLSTPGPELVCSRGVVPACASGPELLCSRSSVSTGPELLCSQSDDRLLVPGPELLCNRGADLSIVGNLSFVNHRQFIIGDCSSTAFEMFGTRPSIVTHSTGKERLKSSSILVCRKISIYSPTP